MNATAIVVLRAILNGESDPKRLAEAAGIKVMQIGRHLARLRKEGYLEAGGAVAPSRGAKTALLRKADRQVGLGAALRGANARVLAQLDAPMTAHEIAARGGMPLGTVYRSIADMEEVGAVRRERGPGPARVRISPARPDLAALAAVLREEAYEPREDVVCSGAGAVVTRAPSGSQAGGRSTAFSAFGDYGVPYSPVYDYYVKKEGPVDAHDVLVHAVAASLRDGSRGELTMSAVFYVANKGRMDVKRIRRLASACGVSEAWLGIEEYIRTRGAGNSGLLLPWKEFVEKARLYDVDPDEYTLPNPSPILREIGGALRRPATAFLIGGENMRLKGLKDSTKDVDLVVLSESDAAELRHALEEIGYEEAKARTAEDGRLGQMSIMVRRERSRVDLFVGGIGGMPLSDAMKGASEHKWYGNLNVGMVCNEHIFLLKAVAGREGDIEDMNSLVRGRRRDAPDGGRVPAPSRFDWDAVWGELARQDAASPLLHVARDVLEQVSHIEKDSLPALIRGRLTRRVAEQEILRLIRGGGVEVGHMVSRLGMLGVTEQAARYRIGKLAASGAVERRGGLVERRPLERFPLGGEEITQRKLDEYLQWRFPLRPHATPVAIGKFAADLEARGWHTLGRLDDAVAERISGTSPPGAKANSLEAARECAWPGSYQPRAGGGAGAAADAYVAKILEGNTAEARALRTTVIVCPAATEAELISGPADGLDWVCGIRPLHGGGHFPAFSPLPCREAAEFPLGRDRPEPGHKMTLHRNGCVHYTRLAEPHDLRFKAPEFHNTLQDILHVAGMILSRYGYEGDLKISANICGGKPILEILRGHAKTDLSDPRKEVSVRATVEDIRPGRVRSTAAKIMAKVDDL